MTRHFPKNICLRLEPELLQRVANHRRTLPDLPNRSESIRRLLVEALRNAA